MKALFLAVSAAAITATLPASATVIAVGGSFAEGCFRAAEDRNVNYQALETCDRALTDGVLTYEGQFATYVNRGILRMFRRDYPNAQADFARASSMYPNRSEPWLNMAILRFKQGDSAAALPLFDRAIQLGTSVPEIAYYGRGLAHEDRGNVKAAYVDLRRAVSLKPDWAEPARELARYQVRRR